MRMTAPRDFRLPPTAALLESMTQCASAAPFPVNVCAPIVVDTLPPTWTKTGRPVGTAYPGQACRGSGDSLPLYWVRGTSAPSPGKKTGYVPPVTVLPRRTSRLNPACQPD